MFSQEIFRSNELVNYDSYLICEQLDTCSCFLGFPRRVSHQMAECLLLLVIKVFICGFDGNVCRLSPVDGVSLQLAQCHLHCFHCHSYRSRQPLLLHG